MMKFLRTQMKWIMAIIVVAFLLSTFLMYDRGSTPRTPGRNPDGSMSDYEVAQINGRSLMRSELEQRLRNYLSTYSSRSMVSIDMPAIYRAVLDQAILESQMSKEVEEKGIRVTDAEADAAMKSYADTYFPTREAFFQVLANSGIKVDDYKRNLARQMAANKLVQDAIGQVTVSEDKLTEFYDSMKNILYSRPEGFNIHMADFSTRDDAEEFMARIAEGESWDVIASGDSLASKDVINITKSPVFLPSSAFNVGTLSVLASLDVGKASPVFEISSSDFAVALKTAYIAASVTPFDEVSGDIRTLLTQQEERAKLVAYEASLRGKASVVINDEELFASPVVSEDNEASSFDINPDILIKEVSTDDSPYQMIIEDVSEDEEPVSEPKTEPEAEPEPESVDVPAVIEPEVPEEPAEPVQPENVPEVSEDETVPEVVETVSTVSEDTPEVPDEPAVVEPVSEDTPEVPEAPEAPVVPEEAPKPEETSTEVVVTVSEDKPLQEEITEAVETLTEATAESSEAVTETITEAAKEAVTEAVSEISQDMTGKTEEVSSDK